MRPRLLIPWSSSEKWLEAISAAGMLGPIWIVAHSWGHLPERIPRHYNFAGEVDAYGGKELLLVLIAIHLSMWLGLTILSRYPHIYNYPLQITEQNAARQYRLARQLLIFVKTVVTWLFMGIIGHIVLTGLGHLYPLWPVIVIPLLLLFVAPIIYLVRAVGSNDGR
ncbi:DUF1648 domain-containing protein [candidate division GN15 bacterium]|nr:DUF1648 domain-containing protein [candidate division GN15 bacterium]